MVFFRDHSGAVHKHFSVRFATAETPSCICTKLYPFGYILISGLWHLHCSVNDLVWVVGVYLQIKHKA